MEHAPREFNIMAIRARWGWARTTLAIGLVALSARAEDKQAISPAEARLKADVGFLADDAARRTSAGNQGNRGRGRLYRRRIPTPRPQARAGAAGYFQKFDLNGDLAFAKPPTLAVSTGNGTKIEAKLDVDFGPLTFGRGTDLKDLPLAFAGYGITSKPDDPDSKIPAYDDYADIDVKDKVVLILRHSPRFDVNEELFGGSKPSSLATFFHKVTNAAKHGAKAVILANDLAGMKGEKDAILPPGSVGGFGVGAVPLVMVTREYAGKLLAAADAQTLEELERAIAKDLKPRSRAIDNLEVSLEIVVERQTYH